MRKKLYSSMKVDMKDIKKNINNQFDELLNLLKKKYN